MIEVMPKKSSVVSRVVSGMCAVVSAVTLMTASASADEPYTSYSYDYWQDPIPSQSVYRVGDTIAGNEMGLSQLRDQTSVLYVDDLEPIQMSNPQDIFYESTLQEFWIADTGNSRILRTDKDLKLIGCYKTVDNSATATLNAPEGVLAKVDSETGKLYLYIADTMNSRVVKAEVTGAMSCSSVLEFTKPDATIYTTRSQSFSPEKIEVDQANNLYVVAKSVNAGAVVFDETGEFTGFYGANRVEATAEIIADRIWRVFQTDTQKEGMTLNVPAEFNNFDIDADGFVYTVTENATATQDAVKRLNAGGYNTWDNVSSDEYVFGDILWASDYSDTVSYTTKLIDVDISENGNINVLDFTTGRVFQYDQKANLISICSFGSPNYGNSSQKGVMGSVAALETMGNKIYVVDAGKGNITEFEETIFGEYVHSAFTLYGEGKYLEAKPDWEEVIKRDGTYTMAYVGLGKAYMKEENYKEAMDCFKDAYDQVHYDEAFKYYREQFLRDNFTKMIAVLIGLYIVWKVIKKLRKMGYLHPIAFIERKLMGGE